MDQQQNYQEQNKTLRQEIEERREKYFQSMEDNLTFQPMLYEYKKRKNGNDDKSENRFDKLYGDALKRNSRVQQSSQPIPSFQPQIFTNSRRSVSPIENSVRIKPTEILFQKQLTFSPQISKRAKSLDRSEQKDIAERLFSLSKVDKTKELQNDNHKTFNEEQFTFAPKINPPITNKTTTTASNEEKIDFAIRLNKDALKRKEKLEEALLLKESKIMNGITFQPNLNRTNNHTRSRSVSPSANSVVSTQTTESLLPVYERLNTPLKKDLTKVYKEIEAQLTFKPKINRSVSPSVSYTVIIFF
jgi:hypothetical protein